MHLTSLKIIELTSIRTTKMITKKVNVLDHVYRYFYNNEIKFKT